MSSTASELKLFNDLLKFFDESYLNPQFKKKGVFKEHSDICGIKGNTLVMIQEKGQTKTSLENLDDSLHNMDTYLNKSKIPVKLVEETLVYEKRLRTIIDDAKTQSKTSLTRYRNKVDLYHQDTHEKITLPVTTDVHLIVIMPVDKVVKEYWDSPGLNNSSNHFILRNHDDEWKFLSIYQNSKLQNPFVHVFDLEAIELLIEKLEPDEFIPYLDWRRDVFGKDFKIEFTGENRVLDLYRGNATLPDIDIQLVMLDDNLGVFGVDQTGEMFGLTPDQVKECRMHYIEQEIFKQTGIWISDFRPKNKVKRKKKKRKPKTFGKKK